MLAYECELGLSKVYNTFSQKFHEHKGMSSFWSMLSNEEKEHCAFVDEMMNSLSKEQRLMELPPSQWEPIEQLKQYIDYSEDLLTTIEEAIIFTERAEEYEITSLMLLLSKKITPKNRRNDILNMQLSDHYKKIRNFINKHKETRTFPSNKSL